MIGKLTGIIDEITEGQILLDVQGVGYVVFISGKTAQSLPERGQKLSLFIETQMREDVIKLFGFIGTAERAWFRLLQNVQGVGAKLALAILGSLSSDELAQALALRDTAAICRAPGVGKKVAERLITELHNKAPAPADISIAPAAGTKNGAVPLAGSKALDAVSALANLGYKADEAGRAIAKAAKSAEGAKADTAGLIRLGLQILAKH
ncbi:MAG: Holliday junction branch migration protein RuvA [Candidatus Tokpelaia sp.]|nr:MAG: Holliday junction branch migration protein RuvA [Candidatus Tokpelaia sp.]KAA6205081.1 MAG: Holliday junction branch migration protein RuvA [Candidatus Tokpelaia sp.]